MKKLYITILTFVTCGAAYALPVANPGDASLLCDGLIFEGHGGDPCDPFLRWCDAFSLRTGFWGDYVFNRHLEIDENKNHSDIEHTKITTNAAVITANLWDRFDLFTTLGATQLNIESNFASLGGDLQSARLSIETKSDFSWSVGARATLWECGCTSFGAEGQYFWTKPDVRRVTLAAVSSVYPDNLIDAKYQEWQVGVGISHRINIFVPYVAVKYSRVKLDFGQARPFVEEETFLLDDAKSHKNWGYAVGVSLVDCEKASLTVEGRFSDERALHVNGQIRF